MQEQITKPVGSIVEALKGNPLVLALVLMNLGLLGFLYYSSVIAHGERSEEMKLLYANRESMAKLLYQCTPSAK